MKRIIAFLFLILSIGAKAGIRSGVVWDIEYASASVKDRMLHIELGFRVICDDVASNCAVVLQPYLRRNGTDTPLTPVTIYRLNTGGNKPQFKGCSTFVSGDRKEVQCVSGCATGIIRTVSELEFQQNTGPFEIIVGMMERHTRGHISFGEERKIANFNYRPRPKFEPKLYILPSEHSDTRELLMSSEIVYPKGQSRFDGSTEGIHESFGRFIGKCQSIVQDSSVSRVNLMLRSWTGISGSSIENRKLSDARAKDLARLFSGSGRFKGCKISSRGMGEDWDSIRQWFNETSWSGDVCLAGIIGGVSDSDSREKLIRSEYRKLWDVMEQRLFPLLERNECLMSFNMAQIEDERLQSVYRDCPELLSVNDYIRLASMYRIGSGIWCDLFLECFDKWPENQVACFNAASAMLQTGNNREAGKILKSCGNGEDAMYLKAVWLGKSGHVRESVDILSGLSMENRREVLDNALKMAKDVLEYDDNVKPWAIEIFRYF